MLKYVLYFYCLMVLIRTLLLSAAMSDLSEVTLILSSLDEWNLSSFSLKYSSIHCSSKSWTFFSSSSVMKSSVDERD